MISESSLPPRAEGATVDREICLDEKKENHLDEERGCFLLVQRKPGSAAQEIKGKSGPQRRAKGTEEELVPGKDPAPGDWMG
ncbi:hypothetical protein BTVI_132808 [Pitangus sulphuratus]|nr:hypothetical protein BTVI_132808 [Pitangus sulphuratus]